MTTKYYNVWEAELDNMCSYKRLLFIEADGRVFYPGDHAEAHDVKYTLTKFLEQVPGGVDSDQFDRSHPRGRWLRLTPTAVWKHNQAKDVAKRPVTHKIWKGTFPYNGGARHVFVPEALFADAAAGAVVASTGGCQYTLDEYLGACHDYDTDSFNASKYPNPVLAASVVARPKAKVPTHDVWQGVLTDDVGGTVDRTIQVPKALGILLPGTTLSKKGGGCTYRIDKLIGETAEPVRKQEGSTVYANKLVSVPRANPAPKPPTHQVWTATFPASNNDKRTAFVRLDVADKAEPGVTMVSGRGVHYVLSQFHGFPDDFIKDQENTKYPPVELVAVAKPKWQVWQGSVLDTDWGSTDREIFALAPADVKLEPGTVVYSGCRYRLEKFVEFTDDVNDADMVKYQEIAFDQGPSKTATVNSSTHALYCAVTVGDHTSKYLAVPLSSTAPSAGKAVATNGDVVTYAGRCAWKDKAPYPIVELDYNVQTDPRHSEFSLMPAFAGQHIAVVKFSNYHREYEYWIPDDWALEAGDKIQVLVPEGHKTVTVQRTKIGNPSRPLKPAVKVISSRKNGDYDSMDKAVHETGEALRWDDQVDALSIPWPFVYEHLSARYKRAVAAEVGQRIAVNEFEKSAQLAYGQALHAALQAQLQHAAQTGDVTESTTTKEQDMSSNLVKVETKTFINGVEAREYSDDQLIAKIRESEGNINGLRELTTQSKAVARKIETLQKGIEDLVEILDARDSK